MLFCNDRRFEKLKLKSVGCRVAVIGAFSARVDELPGSYRNRDCFTLPEAQAAFR